MTETARCSLCRSLDVVDLFQVGGRQYMKCRGCDLIFQKGIQMDQAKAIYRSDEYRRVESQHRLGLRRMIFQRSLDEIERVKSPGRLLDVGCGDGLFLNLAGRRGWKADGVELSPGAYEQAQNVIRLNIFHGELRDARFPDSFFDVVTLYNVLDHLPSPLDELLEIHRIIKLGGLLVLRVPNATFHVNLIRVLKSLKPYLVFHLYCFSPKTIRLLLEKVGYDRISVKNAVLTPFDPYSISPLLGEWGMQAIKQTVYLTAQVLYYLSARKLILGPSLTVHAIKTEEG